MREEFRAGGLPSLDRAPLFVTELTYSELACAFERPATRQNDGIRESVRLRCDGKVGGGFLYTEKVMKPEWLGGLRTYDGLVRLVEGGWDEGAQRAMALKERLQIGEPIAQSVRRRFSWGDEGDEVDRDRVYAGQVDTAWRKASRQKVRGGRTVSLLQAIGGGWRKKAEELFWCGAVMVALSDLLEDAGYQTELWGMSVANGHGDSGQKVRGVTATLIEMKRGTEPLRPDVVAAGLAHAGVFRSLIFATRHRAPFEIGGAHGYTVHFGEQQCREMVEAGVMRDMPDVVLRHAYNETSARQTIAAAVAQLNESTLAPAAEDR